MISVVIPVYRNAETLAELHRRVRAALEAGGLEFEVVYVDDACPAGSELVLEELSRADGRVRIIRLPANVGQHRAVLAGLRQARGDRIVVLDADLQDPPEAIPRLLDGLQMGMEAVFAGRQGAYHDSRRRRLTSRVFKRLLHALLGVPIDAGSFVALTRPTVERVVALPPGGRPTLAAMIGIAARRVSAVPVVRAPRPAGRSAYSSRMRLWLALGTLLWAARMRARRRRAPASVDPSRP